MKAVLLDKPSPPSSLRIGENSDAAPGGLAKLWSESAPLVSILSTDKVASRGCEGWNYPGLGSLHPKSYGPCRRYMAPNSPFISLLLPSVKQRGSGPPLPPPTPKPRVQRPPGLLAPLSLGLVP